MSTQQTTVTLSLRVGFITFLFIIVVVYSLSNKSVIHDNTLFSSNVIRAEVPVLSNTDFVHNANTNLSKSYFEIKPFDYKNCSSKVVKTQNLSVLENYINTNNPDRHLCTFKELDDYVKNTGHFYREGMWYDPKDGNHTERAGFYPKGCLFENKTLASTDVLRSCLHSKGLKKVLITGDSNGRMMARAVIDQLNELLRPEGRNSCQEIRTTEVNPYQYFNSNIPEMYFKYLPCQNPEVFCYSWEYNCQYDEQVSLRLEYIPLLHLTDSRIGVTIGFKTEPEWRTLNAYTQIEFLLKYYFPANGFPDIWIFHVPILHESWVQTPEKWELDLKYVLRLFDIHLPNTTKLIFEGAHHECNEKRGDWVLRIWNMFYNVSRNGRIDELNQMYYKILQNEINTHVNYHALFDSIHLMCPLEGHWYKDAAHLNPIWYVTMTAYILDMFCM